eukprot:1146241-Pelagomonas_calceolata.AAC.5
MLRAGLPKLPNCSTLLLQNSGPSWEPPLPPLHCSVIPLLLSRPPLLLSHCLPPPASAAPAHPHPPRGPQTLLQLLLALLT